MLRFDTILFPVDFSDRCLGAARYVEAVAGRFHSRLVLLHVLETTIGQPGDLDFGGLATSLQWEDRSARARQLLDDFGAPDMNVLNVTRRLEAGDPARTIIRVAREENAGLIFMPTHGYGGFRRFILGSVTAKVLHDATCPVWTGAHLDKAPALEAITIRRIVCALDLTARSTEILRAAAWLSAEYGASLTLAHAVPGGEAIPERILDCELRRHLIAQSRERLQALAAEAGVEASVAVDSGEAARVVEAIARRDEADVVVIGRGQHSGFGRLRTHAYAIIRESPCPVLSI
jgi:nucleotide-binding universal stress UspA family protein